MSQSILVVEDDPTNLRILTLLLQNNGYEVRQAMTLKSTLEVLEKERFSLVVLDMQLPDGNTLQHLNQIQQLARNPVVMLTANAEQESKLLALDRGADDYITKPFEPREFLARVKALLRRSAPSDIKPHSKDTNSMGPFRLLRKIGEGGMGCVYLAEDTRNMQQRAIKIMLSQRAQNQDLIRRFIRESRELTKLDHMNVVKAYEMGEFEGTWFLVMEYCEGQTLDEMAAAGPVPVTLVAEVIMQAARGLGYAHEHGLIHRDIKPGNIMVTSDRVAKVLDFGLLKSLVADEKSCLTQSGFILGTPEYIAPEQANGESVVDGRLDIYSLGCCLYYLLTNRPPFDDAKGYVVIAKHIHDPLPDPRIYRPDTPESLVAVMRKMTAKRPADRYQTCAEVAKALEESCALVPTGRPPSEKITIPTLRSVSSTQPQSDPQVCGAKLN